MPVVQLGQVIRKIAEVVSDARLEVFAQVVVYPHQSPAAAVPGVGPGQKLQLIIDGVPQGPLQSGTLWRLEHIFRGAYDLTVQLMDSANKLIASSEPVRVYVLRPGLN